MRFIAASLIRSSVTVGRADGQLLRPAHLATSLGSRPHSTKGFCRPGRPVRGIPSFALRPEATNAKGRGRVRHEAAEERIRLTERQTAIEALMCRRGGDTTLARIGVLKALNHHVERVFRSDVKTRY